MKLRSQELRKIAPELDPLRLGTGWKLEDLSKPQIMIESTFGDSHPGSGHLLELVEEARKGVAQAGGHGARYFTTDICDGEAQGHDGINYSLASRDMIANMIEIHANATPFDGGVFIASCDKGMPAHLMGVGRVNIPSIIVTGGLLIVLLIGLTALLFSEKQTNKELIQEFQLEKEDLENEYTRFAQQYDELKLTVSNDSLAALLEQEQLKTQRLLEELRTVKSSNATEIRRLKKELATLRKVMVGYINQIDSLNRLTAHQKEVIAEVTRKYNDASQQITTLAEEKKDLDKKVTLAAQLDATNIVVLPQNKRGKKARKVKDIMKLKIDFTIAKNITAPTGE